MQLFRWEPAQGRAHSPKLTFIVNKLVYTRSLLVRSETLPNKPMAQQMRSCALQPHASLCGLLRTVFTTEHGHGLQYFPHILYTVLCWIASWNVNVPHCVHCYVTALSCCHLPAICICVFHMTFTCLVVLIMGGFLSAFGGKHGDIDMLLKQHESQNVIMSCPSGGKLSQPPISILHPHEWLPTGIKLENGFLHNLTFSNSWYYGLAVYHGLCKVTLTIMSLLGDHASEWDAWSPFGDRAHDMSVYKVWCLELRAMENSRCVRRVFSELFLSSVFGNCGLECYSLGLLWELTWCKLHLCNVCASKHDTYNFKARWMLHVWT